MSTARWRVLYDEGCGFCRWCVGVLLALDRNHALRPVAIGSDEGAMLLGDLDERARRDSWHLVDPQGRRTSAGAAVAPLLDLLPAGGPAAAVARALPGPVERAYRLIAGNRGVVGRMVGEGARRRAERRIARRA
ncbi:MAG TPA: DCC1-like thiol-disulfide oxidoreductase family protein [Miltoncostaeaceae bacterium]|jgi:predicted DCC family thiol-disulfide oxidoreductase YuxK|nr:DCC1-like thiol-disulfide oxidoreductase family protein [Miltoncostaeaceae bacterium]